ncbi:hypothetical protein PTNB85_02735 [Pyrenophora teres f. teres]|uniref:Uncharacterized protein n=1 Tax=Pyrenophora teres f. teres TaxID=97479 RepID=A0A6S6W7M4_9PLEO|nr:hypothetical protein HRS9139_02888 [Pyrenophora teres f. teres]KAE8844470.1 hypothetical protein PTNB85_02735 [Pyrenophora teres f. teres]KAE8866383.1 hypothetical protein PTNB29_03530 [Pyrenophora teres f. teres]CAA9962579.1 hypothetical protein PTMSG1_05953 [Pyrenophora teres f. maculata]CAE7179118.1 hypothetical protein PTTW11_06487 [Pyrenophora teres f. teres]
MYFLAFVLLLAGLVSSATIVYDPENNPTGKYEPSQYEVGFIDAARRLCTRSYGDGAYTRTDKSFFGDCYDVGAGIRETDYHVPCCHKKYID